MTWRAIIIALCLFTGCAPPPDVVIDSAFPEAQQEAIIESAETWFTAVPDLRVPIIVSDKDITVFYVKGEPELTDKGKMRLGQGARGIRVRIWGEYLENDMDKFKSIASHELGHFFGVRGHHKGSGTMTEYIEDALGCINQIDIDEMCDGIGRCSSETKVGCVDE